MKDASDWLTEKQLIAETKEGRFTLDRLRRKGLIPWDRRFLGIGDDKGSPTIYPPIAVNMVRCIQQLREHVKGYDRWRLALWAEGYPVDIVGWIVGVLRRLEKMSAILAKADLNTALNEATRKGSSRGKPHQRVFNRMRRPQARRIVLEWGIAIGAGLPPPASIYVRGSPAAKPFRKMVGTSQLPDPSLEVEKMSFERLRDIATSANAGQHELVRADYNRLSDLVKRAAALDWHRVRDVLGVTHQGGPTSPIAPFDRLVGLWENLNSRACVIPFLIFVRTRPGYRFELDERFASLEVELWALSERATNPTAAPVA